MARHISVLSTASMCSSVTSIGTLKTGLLPPFPIGDHPTANDGTMISAVNQMLPQSRQTRLRTVWLAIRLLIDAAVCLVLWQRLHSMGEEHD